MKDVGSANTERALVGTQVRLCGTTRREALTAVLPDRPLDRDWPSGGTELVAPIVGGNQSTAACRIRASVSTFFQVRGQICANGHLHAGTAGCTTSEPENASRGSNHTYLGAPPSRKSGGGPFHGAVSTGPRRQPRPPAMPTAVVTKQGDFLISVRTGGSETVPYNPPYLEIGSPVGKTTFSDDSFTQCHAYQTKVLYL